MALEVGSRIAHYEVTALIGEGGMGQVYRATDTKLDRDVALKVLPAEMASSPERLERFQREAKALAALDHPGIVTVFSVEEADGVQFLTMQLVQGETLERLISEDGLAVELLLETATGLADALAAAHEKGIVHRDLKPANVMVGKDGRVKILDFGLARMTKAEAGLPGGSELPTELLTREGVVMGTVPYMSPEQLSGLAVDYRTDLFSLGVMLYEMATGRRPFQGRSSADLASSILRDTPPPVAELRANLPGGLAETIERCLQKSPTDRVPSARALRDALVAVPGTQLPTASMRTTAAIEPAASGSAPPAASHSVAALPFLVLGNDADTEVFAEGMTEDVIAQLTKVEGLKVIARGSVMAFKQREQGPREIGERLGVSTLLDGSIRRAGDRVRIVVQLVEASSERPLWSETYDRNLEDIFAVQSDVALRVASALSAELSPDVQERIEKRPTDNMRAYRLYVEGRHCLLRTTGEGIGKALELFGKAIRLDPGYALPHAGVAWAYVWIGFGYAPSPLEPREACARAEDAARSAMTLDPDLGFAHAVFGYVRMVAHYDWKVAEREMRKALELSPGVPETLAVLGLLLSAQGRHEEAIDATQRALALDPLAPILSSDLATKYLRVGRFEEAIEQARRLLALEPDYPMAHSTLGWALLKTDRTEEGVRELARAVEAAPGNTMLLAQLGQAKAVVGRTEDARAILDRLTEMAAEQYVSPYHLAYVYTGLGEHDRAVESLERAYRVSAGGLYGVGGSFLFEPLHDHPGFRSLLQRMHLAEPPVGP